MFLEQKRLIRIDVSFGYLVGQYLLSYKTQQGKCVLTWVISSTTHSFHKFAVYWAIQGIQSVPGIADIGNTGINEYIGSHCRRMYYI